MTSRKLSDPTLYKVRVVLAGGAMLHLVARGEPDVVRVDGHFDHLKADFVTGADVDAGDTLAFVDWSQVPAIQNLVRRWRRDHDENVAHDIYRRRYFMGPMEARRRKANRAAQRLRKARRAA